MPIKNQSKQQGFTLIELLVSVGLFSVVLTITLGSILTIADSNKKARSLMSVMNELNFAVDSVTRSFKTGTIEGTPVDTNGCLITKEVNYDSVNNNNFDLREVKFCLTQYTDGRGELTKQVGGNTAVPLTSADVDIDHLKFTVYNRDLGDQPVAGIVLEGTVKVSEKIRSTFLIQTSVSQRKLNI